MTILTAKIAGVNHVIGCTPPIRGEIPNGTVAAMYFAGADEIFILGGVQAIAAMATGTETIRKVDFIAGPGNPFVAEAKRQLYGEIGIDLFAGPTEVLIVADETADPFTVATDILSQAEHGPDSPSIIITNSERVGKESIAIINELLKHMPTADLAGTSWKAFGECIVADTMDEVWKIADDYASEHVQILTKQPREALEKMTNFGAIFLGERTCVSYGDKVGHKHCAEHIKSSNSRCGSVLVPTTCCQLEKRQNILAACGWANSCGPLLIRKSETTRLAVSWDDCVPVPQERRLSKVMQDQGICVHTSISRISTTGLIKDTLIMLKLRMPGCRRRSIIGDIA